MPRLAARRSHFFENPRRNRVLREPGEMAVNQATGFGNANIRAASVV
jgi:hypothetical protein